MTANNEELELKDRLNLIENMIAEGRRTTESWGWTFVLWGVAYYVAIAWSSWGHGTLAWPVTMIAAGVLTAVFASRQSGSKLYLDRDGKFNVHTLHGTEHQWEADRPTRLCVRACSDAGHGQCYFEHDSAVEGAIWLRSGLVVGCCGQLLWLGDPGSDRLPRGALPLPDRLRWLHDDLRGPRTQGYRCQAGGQSCLSCQS
jgi:hypothetical protein